MKKCRRCGAQYEGTDICPGCGFDEKQAESAQKDENAPEQQQTPPETPYEPKHYSNARQNGAEKAPGASPPPPFTPPMQGAPYAPAPIVTDTGARGLGVASLVLGILSLLMLASPFSAMLCGVIAVCFGAVAKKRLPANERGMASGGFITGIIGLVLAIVSFILTLVFINMVFNAIFRLALLDSGAVKGIASACPWF